MPFWLNYQELAAGMEERFYFNEQAFRVYHFMYNPESQNKIYWACNLKPIWHANSKVNAIF